MTQMWIDEQDWQCLTRIGETDYAFLISHFNGNNARTWYELSDRPPYTNRSHEPRLTGWCGTWNNVSTDGEGVWKVVRVAKNGRYLIERVTDRETLAAFLNETGYPELMPEAQETAQNAA